MASSNLIAYHLLFIFGGTLVCVMLGITPMFGAFLAGIAASIGRGPQVTQARESIKSFSFAFFILYFAIVGLQLDLIRHFNVLFFASNSSCRRQLAKAASVYPAHGWRREPADPAPRGGHERPRRPRHRARVGELAAGIISRVLCRAGDAGHRDVAARRLLGLGHVVRTANPCATSPRAAR